MVGTGVGVEGGLVGGGVVGGGGGRGGGCSTLISASTVTHRVMSRRYASRASGRALISFRHWQTAIWARREPFSPPTFSPAPRTRSQSL